MDTLRRLARVAVAAGARLRRRLRGDLHRADGQGRRPQRATGPGHASLDEAKETVAFAYLVTALLFARSGLYAERSQRPGLPRIVSSLFQVTRRGADLRARQRGAVLELLHLLRHAASSRSPTCRRCAGSTRSSPACCCARPATGAGRSSSARASTSRTSTTRWSTRCTRRSTWSASSRSTPRPDNGLRSLGQIEELPAVLDHHRVQEVIIADPDFPQERAVELVDQCHRRGVHRADRAVDDGDPRPPRGVRAGRVGAAVRAAPAGVRRLRLPRQAHVRLRRRAAADRAARARCCSRSRVAVFVTSRGPVLYRSIRPGIGGEPFACFKFRTMRSGRRPAAGRPRVAQRGLGRAVQDPRTTRA